MESVSEYEVSEIQNLCITCKRDMGPDNPRQLCGKYQCDYEDEMEADLEDIPIEEQISKEKTNQKKYDDMYDEIKKVFTHKFYVDAKIQFSDVFSNGYVYINDLLDELNFNKKIIPNIIMKIEHYIEAIYDFYKENKYNDMYHEIEKVFTHKFYVDAKIQFSDVFSNGYVYINDLLDELNFNKKIIPNIIMKIEHYIEAIYDFYKENKYTYMYYKINEIFTPKFYDWAKEQFLDKCSSGDSYIHDLLDELNLICNKNIVPDTNMKIEHYIEYIYDFYTEVFSQGGEPNPWWAD